MLSRFLAVPLVTVALLPAQDAKIKTTKVARNVYMLAGEGGNIGLSVGEDGAFLIDDQFAPMVDMIKAAVAKVSEHPVRFLVNTHYHFDHTGGNERFGKTGAVIVAHANVRKRLSVEQFMKAFNQRLPAAPKEALPVITFEDSVTFHWNGDAVQVFHVENAHTDGDSIVWFKKANVIHTGDVFFNGMYPFIDVDGGGRIRGMVAAADRVLKIASDDTKIIPGHGPLSNKAELRAYRDMLNAVAERVAKLIADGKTTDEVVAARPTARFDERWGGGFMKPEAWTRIVDESLRAKRQPGSRPGH